MLENNENSHNSFDAIFIENDSISEILLSSEIHNINALFSKIIAVCDFVLNWTTATAMCTMTFVFALVLSFHILW